MFFPTLEQKKIDTIIHLGDCFDRRKYVNFDSLKSCREYFFDKARDAGITIHMIVGNHDTYYKNTNDVNSPDLLLSDYKNVHCYKEIEELEFDGLKIMMLPWICTDNYNQSIKAIKETKARVCFGHLELAGFQMWKGQEAHDGFDPAIFKQFDLVCSGHFHHRHGKDNIYYLGNPYQMFWSDYGDERGFHIFHTNTLECEFIANPYTMFEKVYYDDSAEIPKVDSYANKLVKLVVVQKTDQQKYETFIDKLYKTNPFEVKVVEDLSEFDADNVEDENLDITDTLTLLSQYVDALETEIDKEKLKTIMRTLYVEAQDFET